MGLPASHVLKLLEVVENKPGQTFSESIQQYCFLRLVYQGLKNALGG